MIVGTRTCLRNCLRDRATQTLKIEVQQLATNCGSDNGSERMIEIVLSHNDRVLEGSPQTFIHGLCAGARGACKKQMLLNSSKDLTWF